MDLGQDLKGGFLARIPPSASPETQVAAINNVVDRLNALLKNQVYRDDNGRVMELGIMDDGAIGISLYDDDNNRIFLGKNTIGDFIGRLSQAGAEAIDGADADQIWDAKRNSFKIVDKQTVTVTKLGADYSGVKIIPHGLGYAPTVFAVGNRNGTTLNIPLPEVRVDVNDGSLDLVVYLDVDATNLTFTIAAQVAGSFYTDPLVYDITYYILQETAT